MNLSWTTQNDVCIALVESETPVLCSVGDALGLLAEARAKETCDCFAIPKSAVDESFFKLATGFAGEVLQKFVNYGMKFAVYGDFSKYASKPLQDFMRESNRGHTVFFAATQEDALEKLASAR